MVDSRHCHFFIILELSDIFYEVSYFAVYFIFIF